MSAAVDRRELLCAAGHVALGMTVLGRVPAHATSPPPPVPKGTALKTVEGDGMLPLPAGAVRRLGSSRMRVPGYVNALQFAPRGSTLVVASGSELRAWDPRTGKVLFRLKYPERASVSAGRLTSLNSFALLVQPEFGGKYEIRHYAFGSGKSLSESPALDLGNAQHTAFSVDGTRMAVVRQEALHVYDDKGNEKWHVSLPPAAVGGMCFFPDGAAVAVTMKGEVKIHATASGEVTSVLLTESKKDSETVGANATEHIGEPLVSSKGRWLAAPVGDEQDFVYCWDVKATTRLRLKASKPIGFLPDESELITFNEGVVTAWTLATGVAARSFDVPTDDDLVLSPDGKILAAGAGDAVVLIDTKTGKHLTHSADPPGLPSALHFDRDGRLIGLLSEWGGWVEWDLGKDSSRLIRPANVSGYTPAALSADGRTALYQKKAEYTTRDVATGKTIVTNSDAAGQVDLVLVAAMTPDGKTIVAPTENGLVLTTAAGRKTLARKHDDDGLISTIAASGDGRWAAVAYRDSESHPVDIYDLAAGKFLRRLMVDGIVSRLTFAPDGERLAVSSDGEFRHGPSDNQRLATVFEVTSGRKLLHISQEAYLESVIAVSPGGRMLARLEGAQEKDLKIVIWDVVGNASRAQYPVGSSVSAMAFSPDSRTLAGGMHGGPVFLWDFHAPLKEARSPTSMDLDRAWADLRSADGIKSFDAIKLLAHCPDLAVPFLRERVTPVTPPDPKQVKQLIADLDHKEYRKRESAMRALSELGDRVREPLKQALTPGQTPEVRERIERLLSADERPTPDFLRRIRAVEAMEAAGTRSAAELLAHWAQGAAGSLFTTDAEAAAKRLAGRTKRPPTFE